MADARRRTRRCPNGGPTDGDENSDVDPSSGFPHFTHLFNNNAHGMDYFRFMELRANGRWGREAVGTMSVYKGVSLPSRVALPRVDVGRPANGIFDGGKYGGPLRSTAIEHTSSATAIPEPSNTTVSRWR